MTASTPSARPRRPLLRSVIAIVAGLAAVIALSLAADEVMRAAGLFPPATETMEGDGLYAIAFAYRSAFAVLGGFLAARLAPGSPVRHAVILGAIASVLTALGVAAAIAMDMRPLWYPIALLVSALPLSWLGGVLGARGVTR